MRVGTLVAVVLTLMVIGVADAVKTKTPERKPPNVKLADDGPPRKRAKEGILTCPNDDEEVSECEKCQETCQEYLKEPTKTCNLTCTESEKKFCSCVRGRLRTLEGKCVHRRDCELHESLLTTTSKCSGKFQYVPEYIPCLKTCQDYLKSPYTTCSHPASNIEGKCYCKYNRVRTKNDECVKYEHCEDLEVPEKDRKCSSHLQYRPNCVPCHQTCYDFTSNRECSKDVCISPKNRCYCREGYVVGPEGGCILTKDCPPLKLETVDHKSMPKPRPTRHKNRQNP